jgi:hypothetical protein
MFLGSEFSACEGTNFPSPTEIQALCVQMSLVKSETAQQAPYLHPFIGYFFRM